MSLFSLIENINFLVSVKLLIAHRKSFYNKLMKNFRTVIKPFYKVGKIHSVYTDLQVYALMKELTIQY